MWSRYLIDGILNLLGYMWLERLGEVKSTHFGAEDVVQRGDLDLINGRRHCVVSFFPPFFGCGDFERSKAVSSPNDRFESVS